MSNPSLQSLLALREDRSEMYLHRQQHKND